MRGRRTLLMLATAEHFGCGLRASLQLRAALARRPRRRPRCTRRPRWMPTRRPTSRRSRPSSTTRRTSTRPCPWWLGFIRWRRNWRRLRFVRLCDASHALLLRLLITVAFVLVLVGAFVLVLVGAFVLVFVCAFVLVLVCACALAFALVGAFGLPFVRVICRIDDPFDRIVEPNRQWQY